MNQEQYNAYKTKYSNFDQKFVKEIPLSQITISHIEDQVRTAGENKDHINTLADQIMRLGQTVPATGTINPDGSTSLFAGVHRYVSKLKIQEETGEPQTLKVAAGFPEVNFHSKEKRVIWQLNENTELASLPLDTDDYVQSLTGLIKDDHVLGTDLSKITPERLRKYIRKNIPNLTDYKIRKIATTILSKSIFHGQRKFRNYPNKSAAAQKFNEINPWGLSVSQSGDTDQGITVYFAESHTAISQNNIHGAWNATRKDPNAMILIVAYCGDVRTKTRDLVKWRRTSKLKFKEHATHPLFNRNIFDGIVFLPQILMGKDTECQNSLVRGPGHSLHCTPKLLAALNKIRLNKEQAAK